MTILEYNVIDDVMKTKGEGKMEEMDKKKFAQEQYELLRKHGITSRMQRSRIFKAAGPGQIAEAIKLAACEDWSTEEGRVRKDHLECLLAGVDFVKWGRARFEAVLREARFYIPEAHSTRCFFRILDGAMEILAPGSYEFTTEEMEEIKRGLKKRVHEADEDAEEDKDE